jgi:ankyrin repeat protein
MYQDIKRGFEQIVTLNGNQVDSFLSQSLSYHPQNPTSGYEMNASDLGLDLEVFKSPLSYLPALEDPKRLYHAFGTQFLQPNSLGKDLDAFEVLKTIRQQLPSFLTNIPHRSQDEITENVDILCGPPTMQAAQLFVELGVYFASNNLRFWGGVHKLSSWMIGNLPWPTIRPMLSIDLLTVQAFAERFLAAAVEIGNVVIVKDLLKIPRLITHTQSSRKALLIAVENSHADIVTLLLNEGLDVNGAGHWGIVAKLECCFDALVSYKLMGRKPLYITAGRGVTDPLTGAGFSVTGILSDTRPLCLVRTVEVARILIEAGADPNAVGDFDKNWRLRGPPLIMAVARGHVQLVRYLIKVGAHVNTLGLINTEPLFMALPFTALSLAVDLEHLEIVLLLLQEGADSIGVFARRPLSIQYGREIICKSTSLHAAARSGNLKIARLLLEFGADINAVSPNVHGKTALEAARIAGHAEMVALLLESGAKADSSDGCDVPSTKPALDDDQDEVSHGRIELREAVRQDDLDRIKELVNAGVQIDMQIIPGFLPQNSKFGHLIYFQNGVVEQGTILHWAICKPKLKVNAIEVTRLDLVKFLLSNIRDVNAQNKNAALRPILHSAIEMGNVEVVNILIKARVEVNSTYVNKGFHETPLLLAALYHAYEIVLLLLANGADVNAVVGDDSLKVPTKFDRIDYIFVDHYTTAFQASLSRGGRQQNNVIKCLLSHGATMNAPVADDSGHGEIAFAVKLGDTKLVQQLLDLGADINRPAAPIWGRTALQAAAWLDPPNLEMVELLLIKGAHVNAPIAPYHGTTPLLAAAENGHFQIARVLLEAGADPNTEGSGARRMLALEGAVQNGRLDLAYLLLEAGADPQMRGHTPAAKMARDCGQIAITKMIEQWLKAREARGAGEDNLDTLKGEGRVLELN